MALALAACGPRPADSSASTPDDRASPAESEKPKPAGETATHSDKVKVAAIQFESEFGIPAANRRRLDPLVREAAKAGARIVVLPETSITDYMSADISRTWRVGNRTVSSGLHGESPKEVAEPVPGPSTEAFAKLADELDIYLTIPFLEVDPKTGRFFNTVVLASPEGKLLLHYR